MPRLTNVAIGLCLVITCSRCSSFVDPMCPHISLATIYQIGLATIGICISTIQACPGRLMNFLGLKFMEDATP
ncbi:hypothetical protein BGX38DRAFT_1205086 [Terfezia claveryi]|nr:hypothetical protein BGX38DRAFT_1205086 [Terfezia claveryi]